MSRYIRTTSSSAQPRRHVSSALKCLELFELLVGQDEPLGLSELARLTDVPRASVHQQLATLVMGGWVEQTPDSRYRITPKVVRLGQVAGERWSLDTKLQTVMENLAKATRESISLAILDDDQALIVQRIESPEVLRADIAVGTRMSLDGSASGHVLHAYGEEDPSDLDGAVDVGRIREQGYALVIDKFVEGVAAVASPIFDVTGALYGAISIAGPTGRFDAEKMAAALSAASSQLNSLSPGEAR